MRALRHRRTLVTAVAAVVLLLLGLVAGERPAHADAKAKKDIQQRIKEAMENYDLLEYEEARKLLNQALTIAKKARIDNDPLVAQVHLSLGIVYYAGLQDVESARLAFLSAVEIDPKVQIDPAYRTADMSKMLDEARAEAGGARAGGGAAGGGNAGGSGGGEVDCGAIAGVQHDIVDTADAGKDMKLVAHLGADVAAAKVAIMFRPQGATDFVEAKMTKQGGCTYVGAIPADGLRGELVHYYIAAFNGAGRVIAGKGSAGSPNIIEITGGTAGASARFGDDENPLGGRGGGGGGSGRIGGELGGGITVGPQKPAKVYFNIAVGTGAGYVTGVTEQAENKVECCFAPALLHVFPEIGFYIADKTSLGAAVRLGFPIGANIPGHATAAPGAVIRVRHSLGEGQEGLQVSGSIGGGIMRNTIKLSEAPPSMDTDIVALGPLLVGAGAGYVGALGGPLRFVAEVNALAGIPVVGELGTSKLSFGVQFDVNLGLMFGF